MNSAYMADVFKVLWLLRLLKPVAWMNGELFNEQARIAAVCQVDCRNHVVDEDEGVE